MAAAALLAQFRELVRATVATHRGAEIRTEGDSFYVVFPSASSAVAAALAIARAAADSAADSGDRIEVGLGVHAGEAVDTPEGPGRYGGQHRGPAVRTRAAGEVVVSDTVRALARSIATATFVPTGRRRLKGLDEPMAFYRAVPSGTDVERLWREGSPMLQSIRFLDLKFSRRRSAGPPAGHVPARRCRRASSRR